MNKLAGPRLPGSLLSLVLISAWAGQGIVAAEPVAARVWTATATHAAPEAHQAAAADERFFYAIDSTRVAQYDRTSGKRIALSTGEAKHLNSGFIHEGKLYCAHSNYPAVREQSRLDMVDPATMKLTTFKDFGDYGGSLTWAVFEKGAWWANFAKYGKENAKTFLVKFDAEWRELGRWTYPDSVVREWHGMSASGGLWRDGELLVTGHDDRVLFRVTLPTSGSVLVDLGRDKVPFTGQGIARDPVGGGLVGIDRGRRQVIFAAPEKQ